MHLDLLMLAETLPFKKNNNMQCNKKLFPLSFYLVVFGSSLLFLDSSDDGMDKRNHICGMREWTQEHTVS